MPFAQDCDLPMQAAPPVDAATGLEKSMAEAKAQGLNGRALIEANAKLKELDMLIRQCAREREARCALPSPAQLLLNSCSAPQPCHLCTATSAPPPLHLHLCTSTSAPLPLSPPRLCHLRTGSPPSESAPRSSGSSAYCGRRLCMASVIAYSTADSNPHCRREAATRRGSAARRGHHAWL